MEWTGFGYSFSAKAKLSFSEVGVVSHVLTCIWTARHMCRVNQKLRLLQLWREFICKSWWWNDLNHLIWACTNWILIVGGCPSDLYMQNRCGIRFSDQYSLPIFGRIRPVFWAFVLALGLFKRPITNGRAGLKLLMENFANKLNWAQAYLLGSWFPSSSSWSLLYVIDVS